MKPIETRYARSGDVRIAYQVVGQGSFDLVFVPGFISDLDLHWEDEGYSRLFKGRRCRQADEGRSQLSDGLCCPSSGPKGHPLPVHGEKGRCYPCATITCRTAV
ncbi:MAG: hypothetical protein E5X89_21160 [Mesorhizobium sp.]|nr:MAG: hypothetical protein E5X88_16615 [Mesorhizobium sp.]TIO32200.1 MAG: hypothetical protein E5X89_21160 [Mesorhizobium sp.]TIP11586.1 MAG: hypothetical protein E5X73_16035 [Mesorhizobium sp.]